MNTRRPLTLILAIVLLILLSVFGLLTLLLPNKPPTIIVLYGLVAGTIGGLIVAVGLWLLKRWALWVTIVISALNILVTVPGLWIAPDAGKFVSAALIVVNALVLVLVALPATRKAVAAARAPVAQA